MKKSSLKKVVTMLFVIIMIISCDLSKININTGFCITAQAATNKSKALKAYKEFLSQKTITILGEKIKRSECEQLDVKIFYTNNDDIPEMLIDLQSLFPLSDSCALYTYYNGKVIELMSGGHCGWFETYKGSNTICNIEYGGGDYYMNFYDFSKGKLTSLAACDGTDNGKYTVANAKHFTINGKAVSKSKFSTYYKKITKAKKCQQKVMKEIKFRLTKSEVIKHLK